MESVGPVDSGNYQPPCGYPQPRQAQSSPSESAQIGRQAGFIPTLASLSTKRAPLWANTPRKSLSVGTKNAPLLVSHPLPWFMRRSVHRPHAIHIRGSERESL